MSAILGILILLLAMIYLIIAIPSKFKNPYLPALSIILIVLNLICIPFDLHNNLLLILDIIGAIVWFGNYLLVKNNN